MRRNSLDIYYFDKDVVEQLRQSLDLLPEEAPYLYEGGVDFLLDSVTPRLDRRERTEGLDKG